MIPPHIFIQLKIVMKKLLLFMGLLAVWAVANAGVTHPGKYVLNIGTLNVCLSSSLEGGVTNSLSKGMKVEVFEVQNG